MERITKADMESALLSYKRAVESLTGVTVTLHYKRGSKTYGNSFDLRHTLEGGYQKPCFGTYDGFLGLTTREAYDTIRTITNTIDDVLYFQEMKQEGQ